MRRRIAILVIWVSACALYVAAYTSAIRLSLGLDFLTSLVAGIANSLPDALAAPFVLRTTGRPRIRSRSAWQLGLLAVAFVIWSVLGATTGLAVVRAWHEHSWHFSLDSRNVSWKALQSLLLFGVLAGVGRARFHANEAREASARALRAETIHAESRLAVLRAQLNPHFILNVLHSLVGLAERDPHATSSALERLGTTLRYVLRVQSRGSDRVALRDELGFTREYLELERLRLGARLETRFLVDDGALSRIVPPFVLQPLVENAVLHVIAPRARGGIVSIRIEPDGESLVIQVEDDGTAPVSGRSPDMARNGGLGLRLLKSRLDALYGENGTLVIDRSPLGGHRVTLRLAGEPWAREEGSE
ncbi:MAG: sensor histidine kinase [Thermoanaerobaculia bacterium]